MRSTRENGSDQWRRADCVAVEVPLSLSVTQPISMSSGATPRAWGLNCARLKKGSWHAPSRALAALTKQAQRRSQQTCLTSSSITTFVSWIATTVRSTMSNSAPCTLTFKTAFGSPAFLPVFSSSSSPTKPSLTLSAGTVTLPKTSSILPLSSSFTMNSNASPGLHATRISWFHFGSFQFVAFGVFHRDQRSPLPLTCTMQYGSDVPQKSASRKLCAFMIVTLHEFLSAGSPPASCAAQADAIQASSAGLGSLPSTRTLRKASTL
mmetsp:Transcript_95238/g.239954  ORF Transcript_95238/g.239954 Transcript_95238/m.239954 type:complete len:265 (+) Transcript_95238:123-917(+)